MDGSNEHFIQANLKKGLAFFVFTKHTFNKINTIAMYHVMSIILHKKEWKIINY